MSEVKHEEYRRYQEQRQAVNSAIMALLAGSQLAAHTLSLTEGSSTLLGDIFPRVRHIDRFNLKSEVAKRILDDAETHLGKMALPYILAIHEDLQGSFLDLLVDAGLLSKTKRRKATAADMHETFEGATGATFDLPGLQLYHVIREMRNCVIHSAGQADQDLLRRIGEVSEQGRALWQRLAGKPLPQLNEGEGFPLGHDEIVVALAITKHLGKEMNEAAQMRLPHELWLTRAVLDAHRAGHTAVGNTRQVVRGVTGYIRFFYEPIGIRASEIEAELQKLGLLPEQTTRGPVRERDL